MMRVKRDSLFETPRGNGIVCVQDLVINPAICKSTTLETPVKMGGVTLTAVKEIGAFSILPSIGTLRCIEKVGRFCMIAPDVQIANPQHCIDAISPHILFGKFGGVEYAQNFYNLNEEWLMKMKKKEVDALGEKISGYTTIGNDVWIGYGAIIMRGIKVGDGAIIGAGAVVTKDVEPYSVVGGVPAKVIRYRYSEQEISELLNLRWWEYGPNILEDIDLLNVHEAIDSLHQRISSGFPQYKCTKFKFENNVCVRINEDCSEEIYQIKYLT